MNIIVHPRVQHAKNCGQTFSIFLTAPNGTFLCASEKKRSRNRIMAAILKVFVRSLSKFHTVLGTYRSTLCINMKSIFHMVTEISPLSISGA